MEIAIPNKLFDHMTSFQQNGLRLTDVKNYRQKTKQRFEDKPSTRDITRSTLRVQLIQKLSLWLGDERKPNDVGEWMNARHTISKLLESFCDLTYFTHCNARQEVRWVNAANSIPTWIETLEPVTPYNRDLMKAIHMLSSPSFINPSVEFDTELTCQLLQVIGTIIYVNDYTWRDFA